MCSSSTPQLSPLSGLEVVRRVRALPGPRIGILVAAGEPDRLRGFAAGADDEMLKPLALEELAARLRAISPRCRAPSDGARAAAVLSAS